MSTVDLDKIQGVIETEISRATAAERKRMVRLVKDFAKDLIDAINSDDGDDGDDEVDDTPVAPAKKKAVKKKAVKKKVINDDDGDDGDDGSDGGGDDGDDDTPINGADYDITEVDDDEVDETDYAGKKVSELRAICKVRNITVPKGYKQTEIAKMLILIDEEEGEEG